LLNIVIPNYNGEEHIRTCLSSLLNQTNKNFQIIIVDNYSSDNSVKIIKDEFSNLLNIYIISLNSNQGFAKAVNKGIEHSLQDKNVNYILLLNNDIECTKTFVEEMLKIFLEPEKSPLFSFQRKNQALGSDQTIIQPYHNTSFYSSGKVGIVACKMLNFYDRKIIDAAGDFIKKKGVPYARGFGEKDVGQYDVHEYVFGACAGAALYSRHVFEVVGLFDEDFFAYYEDVDFNFRSQIAGFECYYNPEAVCYHKRGATFKKIEGLETMYCERNLISLRIKNYPVSLYLKYSVFFFLGRIRRYFNFLRHNSITVFIYAVKGYFLGLLHIPSALKKRREIQKNKNVTVNYLDSLLT